MSRRKGKKNEWKDLNKRRLRNEGKRRRGGGKGAARVERGAANAGV
jgi:hypothetical protein